MSEEKKNEVKKQLKRTLSLALAILLMCAAPMVSLAAESMVSDTESKTAVAAEAEEMIDEIGEEQINTDEEEQPELLGTSAGTIYWGIKDGVLRISVSEVGGEHSGSFSSDKNPHTWTQYRQEITEVYVGDDSGTVTPTNMSDWFTRLSDVEEIRFVNIDTSNVTDMSYMFRSCSNLESLDVSNFDTHSVTDMRGMFEGCEKLELLDVSNFDTGNVTDMIYMFRSGSNLENLDVSSFDTHSVTNMRGMFEGCEKLERLDVSKFVSGNVTDMSHMFDDCRSLRFLDFLSGFVTGNVTYMDRMFYGCENLNFLSLEYFDTGNVENMESMFEGCNELKTIYVGNGFSTVNLKHGNNMFRDCTSLIGMNGTEYSSDHKDSTYAVVDREGHPGYFSQCINILTPSPKTDVMVSDRIEVKAQINGVPEGTNVIFRIDGMDGFKRVKTDKDGIAANTYTFKNAGAFKIEIAYETHVAVVGITVSPIRRMLRVEFETNGGSAIPFQVVKENETAKKPKDPTKAGNDFAGWFLDPELKKTFDFSAPITENTTLYAKWKTVRVPDDSEDESEPFFTGTQEKPVSNGAWMQNADGTWTYVTTRKFTDTWGYIANPWNDNKPAWFRFDGNGKMLTGWQLIYWNGSYKFFYFREAADGRRGECLIDGVTPDGYTVNKDGAWTVDGIVQEYVPAAASGGTGSGPASALSASNAVGGLSAFTIPSSRSAASFVIKTPEEEIVRVIEGFSHKPGQGATAGIAIGR